VRRFFRRPADKKINGRDGLDPVRYGDWEVKGIASDCLALAQSRVKLFRPRIDSMPRGGGALRPRRAPAAPLG
jgi:hypothetical protein